MHKKVWVVLKFKTDKMKTKWQVFIALGMPCAHIVVLSMLGFLTLRPSECSWGRLQLGGLTGSKWFSPAVLFLEA
eukprot:67426-Amphidinium_carterae.1